MAPTPPARTAAKGPSVASPASFWRRRLGSSAFLLYLVLTATFFMIQLAPGEPARLFEDPIIDADQRQHLRAAYGLDRPLPEQYLRWLGATLTGDWGTSFATGRPALRVVLEKVPGTLVLVTAAGFVEHLFGVLLGLLAAVRRGHPSDSAIRGLSLTLFSVPSFLLALAAIEFFTVRWPLFPSGQMSSNDAASLPPAAALWDLLHHLFLPAMVLGLSRCGAVIRYVRNGVLEILGQDFIRTARAKGLSPLRVLLFHALGNALNPLIQRLGVSMPLLLSNSLIIEVLFSWPGLGSTLYTAVGQRDYPVILTGTALAATLVVLGNLAADLGQALVDPRVRHG
jgi:peptide/nickel transport system permease protein